MPLVLSRLTCGVIYTDDFLHHLQRVHEEQQDDHYGQILTIDYIRCASGRQKGEAWWQLLWLPRETAPAYRCFRMGEILIHIPKSAQHGLRERCLDYRDDRVVVIP